MKIYKLINKKLSNNNFATTLLKVNGDKMGEIDIKKIIIAIILIIAVIVGVFFGIKGIAGSGKKYQLEEIKESDYKFFAVYEEEKYGVINEKGEKIIDNIYLDIIIPNPSKAVFVCQKENGENEILNDKKEKIFSEYKNVQAIETNGIKTELPYEKSVLRYEEEGKFGIINYEGKEITKPIYEEIASVKNKEGEILAKKNGKYGVINNKGKTLIPFEYEEIEGHKYYSNGNYQQSGYIVKIENDEGYQYGYIDDNWKKVLKPEYSSINRITDIEGEDIYLAVAKSGQYALIKNKKPQTDFAYQSILYNKDTETLAVQRGEKYGVISLQGEQIIPIQYKGIRYNGTYICAKTYEEDLYFNTKGENVQNGYIGMKHIKDINVFITTNNQNLYGLMDENGKVIVENTYLYIDYAFDKYFVAYKEGAGHGIIDKAGNKMVEFEYDVLSKVGEKDLLKAVKMKKDGDETTIYSKDLQKLTTMKTMAISIQEDYIEVYNNEDRKIGRAHV